MARDDFAKATVAILRERAAHLCNMPHCRRFTVLPHSNPNKVVRTGRAAHIHAASPGGARYDANQTPEQRSSIDNAIWLCAECADRIDRDANKYPAVLLREWKAEHDSWLELGAAVPKVPRIVLMTLSGLSLPQQGGEIKPEMGAYLKEHSLTIVNDSSVTLSAIELRVQFPEPIIGIWSGDAVAGTAVTFGPDRPQMIASGNGTVTMSPPRPTFIWKLSISGIPASKSFRVNFVTAVELWTGWKFDRPMVGMLDDIRCAKHYFDGSFLYEFHGSTLQRPIFAPIDFDEVKRSASVPEVAETAEKWGGRWVMSYMA